MNRTGIAIALAVAAIVILVVIRAGEESRRDGSVPGDSGDRPVESRNGDLAPVARSGDGGASDGEGREIVDTPPSSTADSSGAANRFRGRVLDVRTGEPVGRLAIRTGTTEIAVDAAGTFASEFPLGDDVRVLHVQDAFRRSQIETLERDEIESLGGESVLRVRVGPTYFLRIVGARFEESEKLVARLVERRADGREVAGIWLGIPGPPEPFFRLDRPWPVPGPDSTFLIEMRSADGVLSGASAPLDHAVGVYPAIVEISLEESLGILHGRVVDPEGRPRPRARVVALPLSSSMPSTSPSSWPDASADTEGIFRFAPLPPGNYEVVALLPIGGVPARRRIVLEPGEFDLGDLVVDAPAVAGSIRGRLQIPAGSRFKSSDRVRLRAVDGHSIDRFAEPEFRAQKGPRRATPIPAGAVIHAPFHFVAVPPGEYELSVVSPFGWTWSPERALVEPPADGVVFVRAEDVRRETFCIDVLDASTKAPIAGFSYSARVGRSQLPLADEGVEGTFCLALPADAEIEWRVWAEGYRTKRLARSDFTASPDGLGASVLLAPGFDARVRVLDFGDGFEADDPSGHFAATAHRPVPGAEIHADGAVLARTNAEGWAEIDADREPSTIEIVAPGWKAAASWNMTNGRIVSARQDVVVWMVRD